MTIVALIFRCTRQKRVHDHWSLNYLTIKDEADLPAEISFMAYQEHIDSARPIAARCAVITLSDMRTQQTDTSGSKIKTLLIEQQHGVSVLRDHPR